MTAEYLGRDVLRGRSCADGWVAKCPGHGDRHPSLSIRQGKNGKILLHCFTGCDTVTILDALGLTLGDLYLDSNREAWKAKKREAERRCTSIKVKTKLKPLGKREAVYRYTDENGELVAEKLRFEGKVFLWRKPDGSRWLWKVDRSTLPLYRLHEVVRAETVYLVEGEKDADRLWSVIPAAHRGRIAVTTAPNGAESWKLKYAAFFAGKKVVILPDSDAPGMKYAELARSQLASTVRSVRIVSVAPSQDVSDYLIHNKAEELGRLIKRTA